MSAVSGTVPRPYYGLSTTLYQLLENSLQCMWSELPWESPWSLQLPLLESLISLHDYAVWSMRNVVRDVEKVYIQYPNQRR